MPVEFLQLFLNDERIPEPDAFLGAEDDEDAEPDLPVPTPDELAKEPDIAVALAAAAALPDY